ncbi:MAG: histidine kinase [Bacteroidota bacterium]
MKLNRDLAFNGIFWLLYFLYQWVGLASLYGNYNNYLINACLAFPVALIFSLLAVHVLFKYYYQTGRKVWFWMGLILSSLLLLLIRRYFNYYIIYPRYFPFALQMPLFSAGKFLVDLVNLYSITGLYALYYAIDYWYREKQRVQDLLQQRTLAELDLLKSQVQPHFIFNTLNNIYGTALKKSPETAALIAHLSGFLNYSLYDTSKEYINLSDEIDYIKHYVELQKNRYGNRLATTVEVLCDLKNIQLAPLLLLPLVENCFKHGVGNSVEKSWVKIEVSRTADQLFIRIENSFDKKTSPEKHSTGGIGLANVKKRLDLLYPDKHNLQTTEGTNAYLVVLTIQTAHDPLFNS